MEHVIEGLLKDFERGRMTRRQLIQSLALAAAAVAPAGTAFAQGTQKASTIPPPHDPAPWKTVWLDHISYAVSDYRRSTAFYRDLMGWEIKNDNGTSQCTMNINGLGEIIVRNNRQGRGDTRSAAGGAAATTGAATAVGAAQPQGGGRGNRPPLTGVINHVSWG